MMTVAQLIRQLQIMERSGHGPKEVKLQQNNRQPGRKFISKVRLEGKEVIIE